MSPVRAAPADLTRGDAARRTQYLGEILPLLYPSPDGGQGADGASTKDFVVIPSLRRPRLLVPAGSGRVAAAAVRRYAEPQSRLARLRRGAAAAALDSGAWPLAFRDRVSVPASADDIEHHLSQVLGTEISVSIHIGPARANRKPVLQLLGPTGDTLAFAKLGPTELTARLVATEAAALATLTARSLPDLTVPRVLHTGQWRGGEVLVQSAVPVWRPRTPLAPDRLARAMRALAGTAGAPTAPLRASAYWAHLRERLAQTTVDPESQPLVAAAATLAGWAGDVVLEFGCWHGDWSPWNMAVLPDTLLLWDWERFATGVPIGFDALHYALQHALQAGGFGAKVDATSAVEACLADARWVLAPMGVTDPAAVELTALLYLLDLAARYLADRQAQAGARLGVLGTWLLPVLVRHVAGAGRLSGVNP